MEREKKVKLKDQQERTLSYYNENAIAFCEGTRNADMSETRGRFLQYLKQGDLILDAGCGSGRDSKFFYGKWISSCCDGWIWGNVQASE